MNTIIWTKLTSALLAVIGLVLISSVWVLQQEKENANAAAEQVELLKQAQEYTALKSRWDAKESQSDLDYLKNHPSIIKQEKRGGNLYLEYANLSSGEFNRITNKLLNSMLLIKKLTLKRDGSSKGIIIVEIEV